MHAYIHSTHCGFLRVHMYTNILPVHYIQATTLQSKKKLVKKSTHMHARTHIPTHTQKWYLMRYDRPTHWLVLFQNPFK